jgi:NTP pyrophosphatase (non-canonical NTP hydrolase)
MPHFNQLSPAEAERLSVLTEELGEVLQAIGKIQRHGFESTHPDGGETNREKLQRELGDVLNATAMMSHAGDIDSGAIERRAIEKDALIQPYLHHQ